MARRLIGSAVALATVLLWCAGASATPLQLSVSAGAGEHPISPYIYGLNTGTGVWPTASSAPQPPGQAWAAELNLPLDRWGGDLADTYNYKLGSTNDSVDYFFENYSDCWNVEYGFCWFYNQQPPGGPPHQVFAYKEMIDHDRSVGASTLFTVPMVGYVAKDAPTSVPNTSCGFPKSQYPKQSAFDTSASPGCGNGFFNGQPLNYSAATAPNPSNDGVPFTATDAGQLVSDLVASYGQAANGGVGFYELGNEPDLWGFTHEDVHVYGSATDGTQYFQSWDELWNKGRDWAAAIKAADPTAKVVGPSLASYPSYFCSELDFVQTGSCSPTSYDRSRHCPPAPATCPGMVEWYLQQMNGYEQQTGTRLLDYLDLHYYPYVATNADDTRALWDPTYKTVVGKDAAGTHTVAPALIPQMKSWIASDYPGTGTSLSEYNFSVCQNGTQTCQPTTGGSRLNAIIQADVLGIFGREGLDLAMRWGLHTDGPLIEQAYEIYRNYDGNHSTFGDVSVPAHSANQSKLSIYAARRTADGAHTIVVINKTGGGLAGALTLSGFTPPATAQRWQWSGKTISRLANITVKPGTSGGGTIAATYPARSITLFVLPAA
jgi:hypothetical protein